MGDRYVAEVTGLRASHQIPKIAIAFVAGMFGAIAGALIYSNVQQQRISFTPPSSPVREQQRSSPVVPDHPAQLPAAIKTSPAEQTAPDRSPVSDTSSARQLPVPLGIPKASRSSSAAHAAVPVRAFPLTGPEIGSKLSSPPLQENIRPPQQPQQVDKAQAVPPQSVVASPTGIEIPAQPAPKTSAAVAQAVTLAAGTIVSIRITEPLSSSHNRSGDAFKARLDAPLVADGIVVAPKDAMVLGVVLSARKAQLLRGRSELRLALTNLSLANGKMVNLETGLVEEIGGHANLVSRAKMATGAAVGAVMGAVKGAAQQVGLSSTYDGRQDGVATSKRDLFIPEGTRLSFTLVAPLEVR